MAAPAIEVDGLHKHYKDVRALDGVSFGVEAGEIFGLLGHNGAGKTTTIRILTGRARPTQGRARVAGHDPWTDRALVRPLVNAVFEDQNLYERLTGKENLAVFADLYAQPRSRVDELLELVGLTESGGRKVKSYSTGMRQRLLVARALVNRPKILFCDEPTRALDPVSAREVRDLLSQLAAEGTTVLLTTHDLEDADTLCRRVAFISQGRIVACDTPRDLKLRYGERTATVLLEDRTEHVLDLAASADARRLGTWMRAGQVLSLHSNEGTLEDVFLALAGRPL
ncbi:MAG TPA: ABC transporter ATP-binding protein [Actinomycetota bacterium]|nr:ABC transporter ATP-binding protein [Actinomycetota bacterium]